MSDPISAATIKPIIELIEKGSPRIAVTVFVVALLVLLVPLLRPGLVPWMDSLETEHATALGLMLLISGVLSGTYAVSGIWSAIKKWRESRKVARAKRKAERTLHERLGALTLTEKHFLQEFVEDDSRIVQCNATLGRLDALCASGVLRMTQTYGIMGTYMISDAAWKYLSEHRDLIATPNSPRPKRDFHSEY